MPGPTLTVGLYEHVGDARADLTVGLYEHVCDAGPT
jgi:hypothetical protein